MPDAGNQLKAFGHEDPLNAGSLIGYSHRKLGNSKFSEGWYELGLTAVLTYQYCGLWQIEQGNRDQAQENAVRPGIAAGPFFF